MKLIPNAVLMTCKFLWWLFPCTFIWTFAVNTMFFSCFWCKSLIIIIFLLSFLLAKILVDFVLSCFLVGTNTILQVFESKKWLTHFYWKSRQQHLVKRTFYHRTIWYSTLNLNRTNYGEIFCCAQNWLKL